MKNNFACFLVLLSVFVCAQKPIVDTAQVVVANRTNSTGAQQKPYVILISADGFRHDYAENYQARNLNKLATGGVKAKAMLPSYPSITFPNHWSLITGMYPSHHGLIDNFFYDYDRKEPYAMSKKENAEDGSWYGGVPLWSLAEKQNVLTASLQWVGSASDAGGVRPSYYYHYHEKFSPTEKINKVVDWLKLPADKRPHFISLYFPEVDGAGHYFGPDAKETQQAVQLVDKAIGELVAKVSALNLGNVNFVFVSDHGMIKVDKDHALEIPALLMDKSRFDYYNSQTLLRVYVKNPKEIRSVYKELKANKSEAYDVYLNKKLPKYLHFSDKDDRYHRIGQVALIPKAPNIFLEKGKKTTTGKHGYDPIVVPEMKAAFYAWGPGFKEQLSIDEFENVNVYPLVAELLGLDIKHPIDGDLKVLKPILKSSK